MSNIRKVCEQCGSTNVRHDASVEWNIEQQSWQIVTIYDNAVCEECNDETTLRDEPA